MPKKPIRKPTAKPKTNNAYRTGLMLLFAMTSGIMTLALAFFGAYLYFKSELPDLAKLKEVRYQSPMKIYSHDGKFIGQFGDQVRYPVAFKDIPELVRQCILAAEDSRFYEHPGFDYQGLLRASVTLLKTGEKRQGGSTITMQVARNFFLSNEKTFFRKIKEIMLAVKIESELPKDQILELYLNKIYLGNHAYGIAAAAQIYYNKTIDQLDLAEAATLAGLPKAPSTFNPIVNPERALVRRDYILARMLELNYIDKAAFDSATATPNTATLHQASLDRDLPYIAEIVRNQMFEQYGESAYNNGYKVTTTVDSNLQGVAEEILRQSLHQFDERHPFRGIFERIDLKKYTTETEWKKQLSLLGRMGETEPALVLSMKSGEAETLLIDGQRVRLNASDLSWATSSLNGKKEKPDDTHLKPLGAGDVLRLRQDDGHWRVTQIPGVGGALVSVHPQDGAVLAIAGGYDFKSSKFNRAIQSKRQPGSGFKPIVYSAALEEGMTPNSIINDAPIWVAGWHPENASNRYYGPTPLKVALAYSRNVVAVRLLQKVGITKAVKLAEEFGFEPDELPHYLPLALGSGSASPLRMAQMYSVFANGGFRVDPYFIEKVETESGLMVYKATPSTACSECEDISPPPEGAAKRVLTPRVHFMMNSMLQDVVRRGTARKALALERGDVAGKTGTTNDFHDAWFNGYIPDMVTIAWFGYDSYKSLGKGQMGGELALPMWVRYMKIAAKDLPVREFPLPTGLNAHLVKTTSATGQTVNEYEFLPEKGARIQDDSALKKPSPDAGGDGEMEGKGSGAQGEPAEKSIESLF